MSRPWPRPPQPRGAFDLVPRSQSAASPLCSSPRPSSSSGGSQGYTLGGAASAEASREQQERQNDCSIAQFKEKERQKKLKKLEETIARYSHLNTAPGHSLDVDDSHGSLPTVREKQCQAYNETVESFKKKQLEHEPKEAQRQAEKLKEKVKKYAYLNTAPGRRLCPDASIHSVEKKLEHDAQETLVLQQSTETLEPLDNDKAMREMRRRLQENYNSSLKHKGQANIEI